MRPTSKVLVIGLDGLEPTIVERMLDRGELPALDALRQAGGYARCGTTLPAQTPVAWSTFATGVNPGGHGIFDFIRRDPVTVLPEIALNRYEQRSMFLPPRVVNRRRGTALWDLLTEAGVRSTVIRCPCTYPPTPLHGRLLAGMGVPDLRGGFGTGTYFTTDAGESAGEAERVVHVRSDADGVMRATLTGPRDSRGDWLTVPVELLPDAEGRRLRVRTENGARELELHEGEWSPWLPLRFRAGALQSVRGTVRFLLVSAVPELRLYASPVNFDAAAPPFPISHPADYAAELQRALGTYYTAGMPEEHGALSNGRLREEHYLDQCLRLFRERERMLDFELSRFDEGLLFCLFDTPDRLQHMFWRFREPDHPANRGESVAAWAGVIEAHYRECDAMLERVLHRVDDRTLVIVLSDHGFTSFRRGVHLNGWLRANGLLALVPGAAPGDDGGDLLRHVDWARTRAYALGLGGIYINLAGRESRGIVRREDAGGLAAEIAHGLRGLRDEALGKAPVRGVSTREEAYAGACAADSPDLVVRFEAGYRASWSTSLGGVAHGVFEDNVRRWSGDHAVDPELVPGVLFMNRPFATAGATLLDLAPTILAALGLPRYPLHEGRALIEARAAHAHAPLARPA